ncbi:MAG TPA: aspartate aminotransferase family protein, partial [Gammaproteobacteria bacterium]|nr:aspartate aminotransferase family protein [Gammaproteobacteria bacterium]
AADIFKLAFDNGLLVRATADIIALAPPLIIQESEVSHLIETLGNALDQVR